MTLIKNTLFFIFILFYTFSAFSEQTVERLLKKDNLFLVKITKRQKELIVLHLMEV